MTNELRGFLQMATGIGLFALASAGVFLNELPVGRYTHTTVSFGESPVLYLIALFAFIGSGVWAFRTGLKTYRSQERRS